MARATGTAPGEVRGRAGGRRGPRANAQRQRPGAGGEGPAELGAEGGGASPRILRLRLLERRGRRGPSRSPEDNESRLAIGARGPKREGRELEAPPPPASTWKTLKAPQPPPPARPRARPARADRPSACGVPGGRALPAATPPRSLGSRPPNGEHSATPLCFRGTHDVPATPQGQRRPSSQSAGTEKSADRREGQRAPPATGEWKSAGRGAQLQSGDPRAHRGELCGAKFKVPLRNALPPRRCAASPGGQRSAESQDWRAGREAGGRVGGVPRARQAAAAPGKVVSAERGVAPRAGAAQVQLGRAGASAKSPGAKRQPGGREGGSPSGRGRGWGRRAERRWSNGEVLTGPRAKLRAARKSRGRAEP